MIKKQPEYVLPDKLPEPAMEKEKIHEGYRKMRIAFTGRYKKKTGLSGNDSCSDHGVGPADIFEGLCQCREEI